MLSQHKTRQFFFVILLLFITWPVQARGKGPQGTIRVGVFPVEPLTFVDKQGVAQGLFPDLLREIVKDESSAIAFVPGSWAEGLERLQKEEIDLILSVAFSPERAEIMDFNYESVVELWGQVFVNPEGKSKNINDLNGRKVAVMRKDITGSNFIMTTEKLGVRCEIVEFATHAEVFTAVMKGAVDAGVAPQHIGLRHAKEYNLVGSSIIFSPFSVFFASKKGMQKELLSHIDAHISNWKKNPDSVYYNRLNYWIGGQNAGVKIPDWLIYASIIGVFVILFFFGFTVLLKRTVRIRTKELQESEAKFRAMVETFPLAIHQTVGVEQITEYLNPTMVKLFGYTQADIPSVAQWWPLAYPDEIYRRQIAEEWTKRVKHAIATQSPIEPMEVVCTCKDGSKKHISWEYITLGDKNYSCGLDITERKQAEAKLAESEGILRDIVESTLSGFWDWNLVANTEYLSPTFKRMFGYKDHEMENSPESWQKIIFPEDLPGVFEMFDRHVKSRGQQPFHNEIRYWHRDGSIVWVICAGRVVEWAEDGTAIRMVGCHIDITERKQAEEALRESQQFNKQIIQSANEGIIVYGPDLRYQAWNSFMEQMTGIPASEVLGKYPLEMFPFLQETEVIERLEKVIAGQSVDSIEFPFFLQSTGKSGWTRDNSASFYNEKGEIVGVIGLVSDITESKRMEEAQEKLQAQLQQAHKMEAIGTLAGGIAHDFNNILGAVIGYTEMAIDSIPPDSIAVGYLEKVEEASRRAASLVKQILAFSRQANTEDVALQPAAIIKEAIKILRPSLPSTITIKQQIDTATKSILADPSQVHQVLMNLCTNAYHAMEERGGTLEISLEDRELSHKDLQQQTGVSPGSFVVLTIGDSGPGITAEIRDKIFDPYFTTKAVGKGTGMGLAIVHGIIKRYAGFITCETVLGKGTVFHVYFPAIEQVLSAPGEILENVQPGKERILFIDDEEFLVDLGKTVLERLGYEVTVRTSSMEAWNTFKNQPDRFDIVITDQTMPGVTGSDLALKMLQLRPNLPIILLTGYSSIISEKKAKSMGIKGFAMKPMVRKEIALLIRQVLDNKTAC